MKTLYNNCLFILLFFTIVLFFCPNSSFAQPALPQRTLTVPATQALHFGTFAVTSSMGGTITVGWDGSRTSTGDIILLNNAPISQPAIFEVKLCEGRNVLITFSETTSLKASGSESSMSLDIGPTEQGPNGSSFITNGDCDYINLIRVGGTLTVPSAASAGTYSGNFNMTFNQE